MTSAQVLGKAADYIEEHGWCQRINESADGRVCVEGALFKVTTGWPVAAVVRLTQYLGLAADGAIWAWNDHPKRTRRKVIRALRAAAKPKRTWHK